MNKFSDFLTNTSGNFAVTFAVAIIPVVAAAGSAVDYSHLVNAEKNAQEALDSAVLAAVATGGTEVKQKEIGNDFFTSNVAPDIVYSNLTFNPVSGQLDGSVEVVVPTSFLKIVGIDKMSRTVTSAATLGSGSGAIRCIHALDRFIDNALILNSKPRSSDVFTGSSLMANGCVVQVNSSSDEATILKAGSFSALENNFGGGFDGDFSLIAPEPIIGLNYIADPFASKNIPMPLSCDETDAEFSGADVVVTPGHYCGDFEADGDNVTFMSGNYYFSGGDVEIAADNGIKGMGVSFVTAATTGEFSIEADTLELKATKTGDAAAFIFFNQSNDDDDIKFKVKQYLYLEGIIYTPKTHFELRWSRPDEGSPLWHAPSAPFSAFIAKTIDFHGYSQLILNHDPSATDLPIPKALETDTIGEPRLLY